MQTKLTKRKLILLVSITAIVIAGFALAQKYQSRRPMIIPKPATFPADPVPTVIRTPSADPQPVKEEVLEQTGSYYKITLKTTAPLKELQDYVGKDNLETVLKLNRINAKFLKTDSIVIIPKDFDFMALSPFPSELPLATSIPKLLMISQKVQAFGVYESGKLIRWGPVSSGKKSTPTPNRLYFANWKGKEVQSSFDDEWVLKWNFNLDNFEGIGMHQYEMPGFPASHSCVRMFEDDAMWLYDWADQWILSPDEQTVRAHGTPVIIFGDYAFGKTTPWKLLLEDPNANDLRTEDLEKILEPSMQAMQKQIEERVSATSTMQ